MYLTVRGLVLRVSDYNDKDALLTLLTADRGRITVKARGLRGKNSPLIAPCQLLAYGEFTLFEYRGSYTINEAQRIELFRGLRSDLQKLSLGAYFAQVSEVLSQEDSPSSELLSLLLNCLYALCNLNVSELMVKAVFELRSSCLAGYEPNLYSCHRCNELQPDRFDVSAGLLECHNCRDPESDGLRLPVTSGVLDALRYIAFCEPKRLFAFRLSEDGILQLSQITETYLTTQLERGFSTLDFYKSLLI